MCMLFETGERSRNIAHRKRSCGRRGPRLHWHDMGRTGAWWQPGAESGWWIGRSSKTGSFADNIVQAAKMRMNSLVVVVIVVVVVVVVAESTAGNCMLVLLRSVGRC